MLVFVQRFVHFLFAYQGDLCSLVVVKLSILLHLCFNYNVGLGDESLLFGVLVDMMAMERKSIFI